MAGRSSLSDARQQAVRVALDLLGGDHAPDAVVDGALLAVAELPGVEVILVGPPDVAAGLLADRGAELPVVAATQVVGMAEDPARAVRAKRDATVRVATRLVRDGLADASVSVGSTGAALAAAVFTLGRLPGVTRPALALGLSGPRGRVVFLDVGANPNASADLLGQFALTGSAYATVSLGLATPRVGLLSNGTEPTKGDALRKDAFRVLAELPIHFVGNVEGGDVSLGGPADVIVTDGFTGNVLLKGMEAAVGTVAELAADTMLAPEALAAFVERSRSLDPELHGGALLLGVDGVVVVGHGASSAPAIAGCVRLAAQAVRGGVLHRVRAVVEDLLAVRRLAAGLPAGVP
ncbi:MAG: phosphate acyltransferase PlsX [Mycobacteriales bacterium]